MREIEFRGKNKKTGEWVHGDFCTMFDRPFVLVIWKANFYRIEVIPETVGQYTGLKDKNGVKIYEGDIVRHEGFGVKQATWGSNYESLSKCCGFMWNGTIAFLSTRETDRCEVIANIHDNPELLKEKM